MVKAHTPINWENEPSYNTPINEANLNKMDSTIGVLDDRIIAQDTSKLDKATAYTMVKDISFNENNGVFTVTRLNGSTFTIDTRLEKIAINFKYDYSTQKLIVTLIDGTTQSIDMSALLTQYEFTDSATLDFSTDSSGKVTATIKSGSITEDMLQPNYLAEIKVETEKSAQSMANAKISENNAKQSELNAKASEEQALEYSNNAQPLAQYVSGMNPTATNSTDGSVIYLNNKGYTQQDGTPSPDNPIRIGASADKGYFDGELKQGCYDIYDGKFNGSITWVSCSNPIYCKPNDIVKISYEEVQSVRIVYFNGSTFVCAETSSKAKEYTFTVPSGVDRFYFNVNNTKEITPSTAKHISVTINGNYAIPVKTTGKNIFGGLALAQSLKNVSATSEIDETNGTVTFNHFKYRDNSLFDNFKSDTQYTFILNGNVVDSNNRNNDITIQYTDGTDTLIEIPTTRGNIVVVSDKTKSISKLFLAWNYGYPSILYYNQCGIFEGVITEEEFEEYQETEALIPTSSPFYKGDFIEVYADGSGREYRANKATVLDGITNKMTVGSNYRDTTLNYAYLFMADRKGGSDVVSTIGKGDDNFVEGIYGHASNKAIVICLSDERTGVVSTDTHSQICEKFNTWLQSNPVPIVYKLATSTSTPLTAEQVAEFLKLRTYRGVTRVTADGEVTMRYYCDNDSGETVSMLQDMVEKTNEVVAKVENLGGAFEVFDVTSVSISVSSGQTTTVLLPISANGYTALGVVGASSDTDGVDIGGVTMNTDRVTAYVKVTNHTSSNKSAKVTIQVLYIK